MTIHEAFKSISHDDARKHIEDYFAPSPSFPGVGSYTGSHFESLEGGRNEPNRITAEDLLAVQTLSVTVPARAAVAILGDLSDEISTLLEQVPMNRPLSSLTDEDFSSMLGNGSPALQLWDLLRRNGRDDHGQRKQRWNVGPTTASKIMARKRPKLIPIEDSIVDRVINRGSQNSWRMWWEELRADDVLERRAEEMRDDTGHRELSVLRTLDIVLWKHGRAPWDL